jgi:hypothetical protein
MAVNQSNGVPMKSIPVLKPGDSVTEEWINEIRAESGHPPLHFEVLKVWNDEDEGQMYACKSGFGCAYDCTIVESAPDHSDTDHTDTEDKE